MKLIFTGVSFLVLFSAFSVFAFEKELEFKNISDIAEISEGWEGQIIDQTDQSYLGWDVEIADADNDGKNEILTGGSPRSDLYLFEKDGSGEWQTKIIAENLAEKAPKNGMVLCVEVDDIDNNGKNEILAGTGQDGWGGGTAHLYLLQYDETKCTKKIFSNSFLKWSLWIHGIGIWDIDQDGVKEVISSFCGTGEITRFDFDKGLDNIERRKIHHNYASGEGSIITDIDNDGVVEYITADSFREGKARVYIYEFDSKGELVKPAAYAIDGVRGENHFNCSISYGDVDNDGKVELLVGWRKLPHSKDWYKGSIIAYDINANNRAGREKVKYEIAYEDEDLDQSYFENQMVVADADNDGKNELIVTTRGELRSGGGLGHVIMFSIDEQGNITKEIIANFHQDKVDSCWPDVADADNDGLNEIVVATGAGHRSKPGRSYIVILKKKSENYPVPTFSFRGAARQRSTWEDRKPFIDEMAKCGMNFYILHAIKSMDTDITEYYQPFDFIEGFYNSEQRKKIAEEVEHNKRTIERVCDYAHKRNIKVYLHTYEVWFPRDLKKKRADFINNKDLRLKYLKDKVYELFMTHPKLDGFVMTTSESHIIANSRQEITEFVMAAYEGMQKASSDQGVPARDLMLRTWLSDGARTAEILEYFPLELSEDVREHIILSTKNTIGDYCMSHPVNPLFAAVKGQLRIAEFQGEAEYRGWNWVPNPMLKRWKKRLQELYANGVDGMWIGNMGDKPLNSIIRGGIWQSLNVYGMERLTYDLNTDVNEIYYDWAAEKFGKEAALPMVEILCLSEDALEKAMYMHKLCMNDHSSFSGSIPRIEKIIRVSKLYFSDGDKRVEISEENLDSIIQEKEESVAIIDKMLGILRENETKFNPEDIKMIENDILVLRNYSFAMRYYLESYFRYKLCQKLTGDSREHMKELCLEVIEQARKHSSAKPHFIGRTGRKAFTIIPEIIYSELTESKAEIIEKADNM